MLKRVLLAVVVVLFMVPSVMAQNREQVFTLNQGDTIWGILTNQVGCTAEQTANLWPMVAEDSGLVPAEDRYYLAGSSISVRRNCDGQLVQSGVSDNQRASTSFGRIESLLTDNRRLEGEVERLKASDSSLRGELNQAFDTIDAMESASDGSGFFDLGMIAYFLVVLAVVFGYFWWRENRIHSSFKERLLQEVEKNKRSIWEIDRLQSELEKEYKSNQYPERCSIGGVVYTRYVDPSRNMIYYTHEGCDAKLPNKKACENHERRNHPKDKKVVSLASGQVGERNPLDDFKAESSNVAVEA